MLHEKYHSKGLKILAFPCNQFGGQEPGNSKEIEEFFHSQGARFDLFEKVDVNGDNAIPLFKYLTNHPNTCGTFFNDIKWNFTKFLIGKNGIPRSRYSPTTEPWSLREDIEVLLGEQNED